MCALLHRGIHRVPVQSPLYRGGHIVANNAGRACRLGDSTRQSEKGRPLWRGSDGEVIVSYQPLTVKDLLDIRNRLYEVTP